MLPFFSVLIALCAFTGGFLGFSATRADQEQNAINSRRVVQNADNLGNGTAPANAPVSAPANAPANSPESAPIATSAPSQTPPQSESNPAVVVDPNPARPAPINPGDDLIPSSQGSASAAEIAAAERASATDAGNAASSENAAPPPGSVVPGAAPTSVPALW
ncbi:MAG: hypothetical protein HC795_05565 [Coleofasciculaceae cyanobacterium RL_1_1]|nr:hypothetical protein [Coleofasciculaceae cyanobacterium RL_1_1]